MAKLTAIDLFAGCGGMSLGLRRAGFNVVGAVEIDEFAVETYKSNHRSTYVACSDIRQVDISNFALNALRGASLDLLAACPPCQGFSKVRTRNAPQATRDSRNALVFQVIRFIRALKPRAVLFENVPGLARDWRFVRLVSQMRRLGYTVQYRIEDAADYGVPQRRRRLLLVATLGYQVPFPAKTSLRRTVRAALATLPKPGKSGDPLHDYQELRSDRIRAMISKIPKNGGSRSSLPENDGLKCHANTDGFRDVYGRMRWDDVAPTLTAGCINPSKGRFLHPHQNRAITLREAALLQSFPLRYRFSLRLGRYRVAEMIGNALPPALITAQAKLLASSLSIVQ